MLMLCVHILLLCVDNRQQGNLDALIPCIDLPSVEKTIDEKQECDLMTAVRNVTLEGRWLDTTPLAVQCRYLYILMYSFFVES